MLRKIILTFSSRLFITAINFLVILITARYLGAEGRGIISLLILAITINLLVSNVFGGAAVSFLAPRFEIYKLIAPSYTWSVFSAFMVTAILMVINLIPSALVKHLFFLSLLQSFYNVHLNVLIGKGQVKQYNLVNFLQVMVLLALLVFFIFVMHDKSVHSYLVGLYGSLLFSFSLSLFFLRNEVRLFPFKQGWDQWRTILKNGYVIQIASIAQLLNYRLSYYLLDHFSQTDTNTKKVVGVYSTAIAIAEAVWLVGKSMGLIQYTRIVKGSDDADARNLTVRFGKISFALTLLMLLPVLIIPSGFYRVVFGSEFESIPHILFYLWPGILSFGMSLMYSNYFAGLGLNNINLAGSGTGLVITIGAGIFLVPAFGMTGAAVTASLSYIASSLFLWLVFMNRTGTGWKELIPDRKDVLLLKNVLKKHLVIPGNSR